MRAILLVVMPLALAGSVFLFEYGFRSTATITETRWLLAGVLWAVSFFVVLAFLDLRQRLSALEAKVESITEERTSRPGQ